VRAFGGSDGRTIKARRRIRARAFLPTSSVRVTGPERVWGHVAASEPFGGASGHWRPGLDRDQVWIRVQASRFSAYARVPDDEPTEETRYGLYRLARPDATKPPAPIRLATTSKEGIGPALVQLADDRGSDDPEIIAVLDRIERRWITSLWRPTSF
jgi:hypothetical protein